MTTNITYVIQQTSFEPDVVGSATTFVGGHFETFKEARKVLSEKRQDALTGFWINADGGRDSLILRNTKSGSITVYRVIKNVTEILDSPKEA